VKQRAAALFLDFFFLMLYNTVVLMPYFKASYKEEYAERYLQLIVLAYAFMLIFILLFRVSPGGKIVGLEKPQSKGLKWLRQFTLRYGIYLLNLVYILVFLKLLLPLQIEVISESSDLENMLVHEVIFQSNTFIIPFYMISIGLPVLDFLSRNADSEKRSILDRLANLKGNSEGGRHRL
jgi:hypothetical protein